MFLRILTLTLCLTNAFVYENFEETTVATNFSNEPIYNIHEWVTKLQLQRCAFVAIGLKYFAIFVEDEILGRGNRTEHKKYFLGICQQGTLETWRLCSPELAKKRKHKCRFKLRPYTFVPRVHRKFCDLRVMVNNKDCLCEPTIFEDQMFKVKGFPTCYIPPLQKTLCKYNACGLSKCNSTTVEERVHAVECDSNCKGGNPFCEYPIDRTSRVPAVRSFWSKWREGGDSESPKVTAKKHSAATCINKYTGKGDVDCLGPGTGCCPRDVNCTCDTVEENGVLKVERIMYEEQKENHSRTKHADTDSLLEHIRSKRKLNSFFKEAMDDDNDYDIEDDDDEDDDLEDDIVLEECIDDMAPRITSEDLEELDKGETLQQLKQDILEEVNETGSTKTITNASGACTMTIIVISLCLSGHAFVYF